MRVIAGICKGRILVHPRTSVIRPTSDRVKESIFNIIGERLNDQAILDLFSGTGNLAIEALSRGAGSAIMVDRSREAIEIIYQNVNRCGFATQCTIVRSDVHQFLNYAVRQKKQFGLIFADPPYLQDVIGSLIEIIDRSTLLNKGGLFILEHWIANPVDFPLQNLEIFKQKIYGDTAVTFFNRKESE